MERFSVQPLRVPYLPGDGLGLQTTRLTHRDTTMKTHALNFDSTANVTAYDKVKDKY